MVTLVDSVWTERSRLVQFLRTKNLFSGVSSVIKFKSLVICKVLGKCQVHCSFFFLSASERAFERESVFECSHVCLCVSVFVCMHVKVCA